MAFGVYKIENKANGKVYIGGTVRSFQHRWIQHRSALRRGKHYNSHLQRAWNKYGEEAFDFIIIEPVSCKESILRVEQKWLDFYMGSDNCYNIAKDALAPMLGRNHTDEAKRKIAARCGEKHHYYGKRRSEETLQKMRAFRGPQRWNYGKKTPQLIIDKMVKKIAGPYPAFINLETRERIQPGFNLQRLCRERGFAASSMHNLITGKQRQHKGWALERKETS